MIKTTLVAAITWIVFLNCSYAQWVQIKGPYGSNVNCLAILPATGGGNSCLFAGTDSGGVYLTTDDGATWTQANRGLPDGGIGCFLVRNIKGVPCIFAGTKTTRDTIFLSTNSGADWVGMSNGLSGWGCGAFGVMGTDIYVALSTLLFRSTDEGAHWTKCGEGFQITSITTSDTNLFFGTSGGGGVLFSSNKGATWTIVNKGLPDPGQINYIEINCLASIDYKVFAGSKSSGVFLTRNNGAQWDAVNRDIGNSVIKTLIAKDGILYAGTSGGVWYTNNDGTRWYGINTSLLNLYVRSLAIDGTTLYAGVRDGSVWRLSLTPSKPVLSTPVNGLTSVTSKPALFWGAVLYSTTYQIQVARDSLFQAPVFDRNNIEGPYSDVGTLDTGTKYYWRVRAYFNAIEGPWSEVWSFTTEYPALEKPQLLSPFNGATEIGTDTTFTWNPVNDATQYHLELTQPPQTILDTTVLTTSVHVYDLSPGASYAWRVQALNTNVIGPWTKSRVFSTKVQQPEAPYLKNPINGAISILRDTTLSWYPAAGYSFYRLQLAENAAMSPTILDVDSIYSEMYQVHALNQRAAYYWRVSATGASGNSGWSSIWSFQTIGSTNEVQTITPSLFSLSACYPNPVRSSGELATVMYRLEAASDVRIVLFDLLGRERMLLHSATSEIGEHSLLFQTSGLPVGVYFIRMQAGGSVRSKAVVITN
jgi:photosystem II stability/assembly factor-like uncharacterized protein